MLYDEATRFLESFIDYEKIFGSYYTPEREELSSIRALLERIGNPEKNLNCVHIAGTKGKGSTAAMTASIFSTAGMKTGLYTSPHLVDFRERIRVDGRMISEEDCITQVEAIEDAAMTVRDDPDVGELSFFEVYTALALRFFRDQSCDLVVIETGLGGRLDATNVIMPLACAITLIGHDHEAVLGDTLEKIAVEKAGILKHGIPAVIASQPPSAKKAIALEAQKRSVPIYWLCEGSAPESCDDQLIFQPLEPHIGRTVFSLEGIIRSYPQLEIPLLGHHQVINAATSVVLSELASKGRFDLPAKVVGKGLMRTEWPGRFHIIAQDPVVVLDGAHNPESAKALRQTLQEQIQYERLILIFGGMSDHNLRKVAEILFSLADCVILTKTQNPRAATPEDLLRITRDLCKRQNIAPNISEALLLARRSAGSQDAILVTGSLYLVGDALSLFSLRP